MRNWRKGSRNYQTSTHGNLMSMVESPAQSCSLEESYRYAREVTRRAGSNFYLAFRLLPQPMYRAMCVIYAYMRISDDLADANGVVVGPASISPLQQLANWELQVRNALEAGAQKTHPLLPALIDVTDHFSIESDWLLNVLTGMRTDLTGMPIQTDEDLRVYCEQVAGMSGLCCQAIWGADLTVTKPLALQCGEAFQRTNILRDLQEDALRGRCYLPEEERAAFGCHLEQLQQASMLPASWKPLLDQQLARTASLYRQAAELEDHLTGAGRRMFRLMFALYSRLFRLIEQDPAAAFSQRVRLSRWQKSLLFLRAPCRPVRREWT
ncbi:MAG: phytoene/squalene synthase family protein [Planctomycetaceae bacterium]|nr:phytoene/squalene synthase family protein [Planctomycetaceae bacterium]